MGKRASGDFVPFDLERLEPDPAVSALISRGQMVEQQRRLPVKERQKRSKQRAKDAKRSKVLYDAPEEIIEGISRLAGMYRTTASGVASLALKRFLADEAAGVVDLRDYLEPMDHPRYEWRVRLEKVT